MTTTRTKQKPTPDGSLNHENARPAGFWHRSMPKQIVQQCETAQNSTGWQAWTAYLNQRQQPAPLEERLKVRRPAMLWALPDELVSSDTETLIRELCELARNPMRAALGEMLSEQLRPWLTEAIGARPGAAYLLECVALCHAMPSLARTMPGDLWWNLLDHLIETASSSGASSMTSPISKHLQKCELPLALFYQFPEIQPCRDLRAPARQELSEALVELLDGEGMIDSKHFDEMYSLLACWTRCQAMGENWKKGCWDEDAEEQYEWAVRQALRFVRSDGRRMFSRGDQARVNPDLLLAALRQGGDDEDYAAAKHILTGSELGSSKSVDEEDLPSPAANSEWAGAAILRRDWTRQSERLAVKYGESDVEIELCSGGDVLLTGIWEAEIRLDGKSLAKSFDWEEICWTSDDDVDYLEIETDLAHGFRLQRQMLLAREDRFLMLCDIVLGGGKSKAPSKAPSNSVPRTELRTIEYHGHLPLAEDVNVVPEKETREVILHAAKRSALVMPLALGEWRDAKAAGSLTTADGRLTLEQRTQGRNLCCPLFIDLDTRRMAKQRTWRQLTVAEDLEVQPADVAVGYRVQCGKTQWLYYRSLSEPANRSLLGENLSSECMVGRFSKEDEMDELLEIE